jgi:hypothetical protein
MKSKLTTKEVDFDGGKMEIIKLNMKRLKSIQKEVRSLDISSDDYTMHSVYATLRQGVVDAEEMTNEDFEEFNPKDLAELANEVMLYSGIDLSEEDEAEEEGNSLTKTD